MKSLPRQLRGIAFAVAAVLVSVAGCSNETDGNGNVLSPGTGGGTGGTGVGTGGGTAGSGAGTLIDAGYTGDGEIDPDSACAATTLVSEDVPLDMYFMLDTSGSMAYDGKMAGLLVGIFQFLGDPASAGLGAAAQRFPIPVDTDPEDERCNAADYATPELPWGTLPYPALRDWVLTLKSGGFTPTLPALQGAVDACRARLVDEPGHNCVVVVVTDGKPEGQCEPTDAAAEAPLGALAAAARADGISVFAIGFPGLPPLGQSVLETIASSGGTGGPILIQGGDVGQEFIDALSTIRGKSLGCEYQMPTTDVGVVDPDLVKVQYTSGSAAPQTIPRKMNESECGNEAGWYYDDNDDPTRLIMCPATCSTLQGDPDARIDILLGCTSNQR